MTDLIKLILSSKLSPLVLALMIKHLENFGPKLIGPNMFVNLIKKSEDCLVKKVLKENFEEFLSDS